MQSLLKFITCGSVDDGKSTLIGHMLYDAKLLFADQEKALELDSKVGSNSGAIDYSLLLDGLMAEREQGITIDVAYRYFTTEKRSFIVADTPGHEEYTRNMAVGASFADLAVILVDASKGVLVQTKRHSRICALMGIRNVVYAVNKMDLIDYEQGGFERISTDIKTMTQEYGFESLYIIPVSATEGDNITNPSNKMLWYHGQTLLSYLEEIDVSVQGGQEGFVLPIQRVSRPDRTFRGFQGQIEVGGVHVGDEILVLPNQTSAKVKSIHCMTEKVDSAYAGQAVTVELDSEIDVSRGCIMVRDKELHVGKMFTAKLLWMDDSKLVEGKNYYLKIGTQLVPAIVMHIKYKLDVNSGQRIKAERLFKNEIAVCDISCSDKIVFDQFQDNKQLGGFILIDRVTNMTSACGVVEHPLRREGNLTCNELEKRLFAEGKHTMVLDGDNVRMGLNKDLGFKESDRIENIRRIAEVAKLMNDAGLIVLTSFISPYIRDRRLARETIGQGNFIEIYVATSLEECEKRDVKGLYQKARKGEIPNFSGISSPYEVPENPEIVIDTTGQAVEESVEYLLEEIKKYI